LDCGDEALLGDLGSMTPSRGGIWTAGSPWKGSKARGEAPPLEAPEMDALTSPEIEPLTSCEARRAATAAASEVGYKADSLPYRARCWRAMRSRRSSSLMVVAAAAGLRARSGLGPWAEVSVGENQLAILIV
jgi:hypothetical protein